VNRRVVAALEAGDPDTYDRPARRLTSGLLGGVLIAALVIAGAAAYGLDKPIDGSVLVLRETGARYLLLGGQTHPIPNWSSAQLIDGDAGPASRVVSRHDLAAYPVGRPLGILDAPDPAPEAGALLGLPWTVCSVPALDGTGAPSTRVLVGRKPDGTPAAGDPALLVRTDRGERYLLWRGLRHRVSGGLGPATSVLVSTDLLTVVTAGPDLATLPPGASLPDGRADLTMVCASYDGDEAVLAYHSADARALRATTGRAIVPAGRGALARDSTGDSYLVTDRGLRYPLRGTAAAALGYSRVSPVSVPAAMLALVPAGPALDPAAARAGP
jgi:Type VII secretion system ESX-1, transport TM domain B